jgi:hypothetical protein
MDKIISEYFSVTPYLQKPVEHPRHDPEPRKILVPLTRPVENRVLQPVTGGDVLVYAGHNADGNTGEDHVEERKVPVVVDGLAREHGVAVEEEDGEAEEEVLVEKVRDLHGQPMLDVQRISVCLSRIPETVL